jgi:hypothetical protein
MSFTVLRHQVLWASTDPLQKNVQKKWPLEKNGEKQWR